MKKSTIIILTDLTHKSEPAIKIGFHWANKLGCKASLVNVHKPISTNYAATLFPDFESRSKELSNVLDETLMNKLSEQAKKYNDFSVAVDTKVLYAQDLEKFVEFTKELNTKLLIIPLASEGFDDVFHGKSIEKIIRISPVPVLIVKDERVLNPKKITFPFAFQGLSEDSSYFLEIISENFKSKITPIHLYKKHNDNLDSYTLEDLYKLERYYENADHFKSMNSRLKELQGKDLITNSVIKSYDGFSSKDDLLEEIEKLNPDLIVMGSSAKSGFERLYLGSFCEYVIRNTPSSLLITKKF